MKNFFNAIGKFIQTNTATPNKSLPHFIRNCSVYFIMLGFAGIILVPIFHFFGAASNMQIIDNVITLVISCSAFFFPKLFIKE